MSLPENFGKTYCDIKTAIFNRFERICELLLDVTVVDAMMGRGKSSAAIRYMNDHKDDKRFMYITPLLTEVDRICQRCDFEQPDSDIRSKSTELKRMLYAGENISATHALFSYLDEEAVSLITERHYTLVIDEELQVVSKVQVSEDDKDLIVDKLLSVDEAGKCSWIKDDYDGVFNDLMSLARTGSLYVYGGSGGGFLEILNPAVLTAFDSIFILTYLFKGSMMDGYLQFQKIPYRIIGVESDEHGSKFSQEPDRPPGIDYSLLIDLYTSATQTEKICASNYALSRNWFARRGKKDREIQKIVGAMHSFFHANGTSSSDRMWTCFKDEVDKMTQNGRYKKDFLQLNARATNDYANVHYLAYMVNRFSDPYILQFFKANGCDVNDEIVALSGMLQWIWRSAIRRGERIHIYIPSKRMRDLLIHWLNSLREGV